MRPAILLAMLLLPATAFAQPKAEANFPPSAAAAATIKAKTSELANALNQLRDKDSTIYGDVHIYFKAAVWVVKLNQFPTKDTVKQTIAVLDSGLARANAAKDGKTPWRDVRGKPIIRGMYSLIDGSVQPYAVTIPEKPSGKRFDVVLHGRDDSLTEVKFIASHESAKPKADLTSGSIIVEPYGRGNLAYRWAAERDVLFALVDVLVRDPPIPPYSVVLRGFSMGGAGVWHLGFHYPHMFTLLGPGAGFTSTRGYIKNLPDKLPDYVEKCLHIYDAVDYAENAFNLPIVAYSGEKDPQKAAADNIERALANFEEPFSFKHLIAPGLEHKQPPEWLAKCEAEYRKQLDRPISNRSRFVTYTTIYNQGTAFANIQTMGEHYKKAVLDITEKSDADEIGTLNIGTENVTAIEIPILPKILTIDGEVVPIKLLRKSGIATRKDGTWQVMTPAEYTRSLNGKLTKINRCCGPIDDAFRFSFAVVPPKTTPDGAGRSTTEAMLRFEKEWQRWFRADLPQSLDKNSHSVVLFGLPSTNPKIAEVLQKLPITWTDKQLVVNGITYDAATHYPAMIYPRDGGKGYVVLNSGHTFHEADLKGSNANLYPRLGDWAVMKIAPTAADPAATEVVAAGLFDEFWQFKK